MISSSSTQPQQSRSLRWVSFGIYEPQGSCDIHNAVTHMARVAALIEQRSNIKIAILKSLRHSWAAIFAVWNGESGGDNKAMSNLPEAAAFTKGMDCAVKIVDSGWFRQSSQEITRGIRYAQLSLGDIVSVRRMYVSSSKKQDLLSYCCLAVLKSYFSGLNGILSYSFYDSLDGMKIIGLGVWDGLESASFLQDNPNANPALPFWKDLGAKKLSYEICEVVYVTCQTTSLQNCRPFFQI
eukprot:PITA_10944